MIKIALNALDIEENIFRPITFRFRQFSQFASHTTLKSRYYYHNIGYLFLPWVKILGESLSSIARVKN